MAPPCRRDYHRPAKHGCVSRAARHAQWSGLAACPRNVASRRAFTRSGRLKKVPTYHLSGVFRATRGKPQTIEKYHSAKGIAHQPVSQKIDCLVGREPKA